MTNHSSVLLSTAILLVLGCQRPMPEQNIWDGHLKLATGKSLKLRMYLDLKNKPSGFFLVSNDRTSIPEIAHNGDSLVFFFSEYRSEMRGRWSGSRLSGRFLRFRADTVAIPFEASPELNASGRAATPSVPPVGTFQVYFEKGTTADSSTMATFWTKNDSVFGTFIAPDGDYGLLAGVQNGNRVQLCRFTGWQATYMELEQSNGSWSGSVYFRNEPGRPFRLEPRPSLPGELPEAMKTRIKNPNAHFTFEGMLATGDSMRSTEARFRGKALIVDIMGTWCHNCMDASPLLQQIYSQLKDRGLEVVGLSFELTDDPVLARKNIALYQARYGITFRVLFCGSTEDKYVARKLHSQLENFYAYPTTLFIDPKGKVIHIHEGFKGPGTGDEYQREVQMYYEWANKLLGRKR